MGSVCVHILSIYLRGALCAHGSSSVTYILTAALE